MIGPMSSSALSQRRKVRYKFCYTVAAREALRLQYLMGKPHDAHTKSLEVHTRPVRKLLTVTPC